MATLFNTKIKDTYQSLLKLEDNTILTTTSKNITDGLGNASPLYMSTTRIGIGTNAPTSALTINGSITFSSYNNTIASGSFPLNAIYTASVVLCSSISDSGGVGISFTNSGGSAYARFGFPGNLNNTIGQSTYGVVPDLGARLGVRGAGSTSATSSLLVQNSAGTDSLRVYDDRIVEVPYRIHTPFIRNQNGNLVLYSGNFEVEIQSGNPNNGSGSLRTTGDITTTDNQTKNIINVNNLVPSTSASFNTLNGFAFTSAITQTTGTIRGLFINPTLNASTDFRAIETVRGNVILGSTSGNLLLGTTTDNGAKLRIEGGDLSITGYQPKIILNGTSTGQSYMRTNLAVEGYGLIGGIGLNTDTWLVQSAPGGVAYNIAASMHFKVNGTNPLTSTASHWLAGDPGKGSGYQFLTTHYNGRNQYLPSAWYGPEISGGIVGLQQFNIGYEPKQYAGAGFTFVGVGLSGVVTDPFTRVTEFNPIRIDYSLASGGSNITARGVYYKPTFTSVYPLLVNNAFESTSGSLVMSGNASRVSSTIARGAYLNQTLSPANMTGDTLIGLDINPTFTSSATQISTFTYVGGSGYTFQTTWTNIPLTGGTGTGATVNITVGAGNLVTAVSMANRGTGYTVNDVLTLPAQNMTQSTGFSVTVTAVGASTFNSYGLLVRNGSVGIGTSTPTARLQVQGTGSTSVTTSLLVQNSLGTAALQVADNGNTSLGSPNFNDRLEVYGNILIRANDRIRLAGTSDGNTALYATGGANAQMNVKNGSTSVFDFTFGTIGATTRMLRVNSHDSTTPSVVVGNNATSVASAVLVAESTTQGFLPPRMTDAQIRAIASPVNGLVAYNTTIDHLCVYQGGAWVKFNHSPM
jgi:hypothetical protein